MDVGELISTQQRSSGFSLEGEQVPFMNEEGPSIYNKKEMLAGSS